MTTAAGRATRRLVLAAVALVIVLGLINVLDYEVQWFSTWLGLPCAAGLIAAARWFGLTWSELGLGADRLRAGALYAAGAIAVVGVVYAIAVAVPVTRRAFLDTRFHTGASDAVTAAFVRIPLGTIVFEEVAFRGVLWALFARALRPVPVLLATSVLFGLWHVLPSLHLAAANAGVAEAVGGRGGSSTAWAVLGAVGLTTAGGIVFGELRRRSGSLVASGGLHWATNGLGVLFGLLAWHLR